VIGADAGVGVRRIIGAVCLLWCGMALVGCGGARSILRPSPETPETVDITTGFRVTLAPVTAAPDLDGDDVRLLSRFYTALWVEMRNDAPLPVTVDPAAAIVFDRTGTPWVALNRTQRVQVLKWRPWSWGAWKAGWVSAGRLEQLTAKLDRLQLGAGPLAVGETRRGVLIFKQMPTPVCQRSTLEWWAGRVEEGTVNPPVMTMVRMAMEC
jgi:hypothetical protein